MKLIRHFPLRHDTLVPQATDPLGEEGSRSRDKSGYNVWRIRNECAPIEGIHTATSGKLVTAAPNGKLWQNASLFGIGYGNSDKRIEKEK